MAGRKRPPKQPKQPKAADGASKSRALVPSTRAMTVIDGETGERVKEERRPEFDLESGPIKGEVPERVITELMSGKQRAQDLTSAFGDACKAMAEKYGVKAGALKRYVSARVADKCEDARAEADDLVKLLGA